MTSHLERRGRPWVWPWLAVLAVAAARPRPAMPKITKPVMFDTPEADAILAALQVFPPDNPWNQDISGLPVHKDSAKMVASIGAGQGPRSTTSTWASSSCPPTRSASR